MQISEKGQKLQTEFVEKERTELKKIFDRMDPIVAAIAKRDGLAMVFEKTDSGLVFAEATLDLTNELVRTYNEKYPIKGGPAPKPAPAPTPTPAPRDAPAK
jgi:Skp family chaperone for outer membrane proteins